MLDAGRRVPSCGHSAREGLGSLGALRSSRFAGVHLLSLTRPHLSQTVMSVARFFLLGYLPEEEGGRQS